MNSHPRRFTKAFPVYLTGDDGLAHAIVRDISSDRLFVEARVVFPLGSRVWVTFTEESAGYELSALVEVRFQCHLSYAGPPGENSVRGMGLRIIQFDAKGSDLGLLGQPPVLMQ